MALAAAFSSRILLIAGAGYAGTVLVQKGKLSELIGELQAIVKGIEKGESDGDSGHADAVAQQVRRLAQEVRQLASSRQITVLNGNGQSGNVTGLIIPAAALGAVGYGYMWWKGLKLSDLMYVTKKNMSAAVSNLTKHLEDVSGALAKAKEHLTQRIQGLDDKMDAQKEISKAIQNDVSTINDNIHLLDSDLSELQRMVSGLDGKIGSLEYKQELANMGIAFLCNFANGKKVTMPKVLEDRLNGSGRTRSSITFHQGSGGMGLKSLTDSLARSASVPVYDIIEQNGEEPLTPSTDALLRLNAAKC